MASLIYLVLGPSGVAKSPVSKGPRGGIKSEARRHLTEPWFEENDSFDERAKTSGGSPLQAESARLPLRGLRHRRDRVIPTRAAITVSSFAD